MDATSRTLFSEVVSCLNLSMIIGPGLVRRSLEEAGADPETAGPEAYERSLDTIEKRLASYMSGADASQRIAEIRVVLARAR